MHGCPLTITPSKRCGSPPTLVPPKNPDILALDAAMSRSSLAYLDAPDSSFDPPAPAPRGVTPPFSNDVDGSPPGTPIRPDFAPDTLLSDQEGLDKVILSREDRQVCTNYSSAPPDLLGLVWRAPGRQEVRLSHPG